MELVRDQITLIDEYHEHYPDFFIYCEEKTKPRRLPRNTRLRIKLLKQNPFCNYCNIPLNHENATLDHVLPRSKGGSNKQDNIVLACKKCNSKKSDMSAEKFLKKLKNNQVKKSKPPIKKLVPYKDRLNSL